MKTKKTMNQQKLAEWILKQKYFFLSPECDGMRAYDLAGIIIREGQDEIKYAYSKVGTRKATKFAETSKKENMVKCQIPNCLSGELVDGRYARKICDKCEEHLLG